MKFLSAFAFDIKFQWRHGFYIVYAMVCACYWILLNFISNDYLEKAIILLTFSDPSALGLILAGGILLLERDQGIHNPLFVTPLRTRDYLLAKVASLSVLSLTAAWVIHITSSGIPQSPLLFSVGVVLTSSLMTLLSIGVVVRYHTINGFILMSQVFALPLLLPLLGFFELWNSGLFYLLPTEGTLVLLGSAFSVLSAREVIYALFILLIWNYVIYNWANHSFKKYVLGRIGERRTGN
ncbi:fluoroquinolone export ABC transporter permease subunit [Paenibacillus illinoisensis]|uniref:ABC transporter n=1 Tax=Paenibacillus illinoisensis TaxID=59845 RepID=A0A2W0C673_9BACL|nr:ABC transporter permease [Paenibacillus illinoisensis]PYY25749.1 ABC transporter [Paenibacillus illinoisensis]